MTSCSVPSKENFVWGSPDLSTQLNRHVCKRTIYCNLIDTRLLLVKFSTYKIHCLIIKVYLQLRRHAHLIRHHRLGLIVVEHHLHKAQAACQSYWKASIVKGVKEKLPNTVILLQIRIEIYGGSENVENLLSSKRAERQAPTHRKLKFFSIALFGNILNSNLSKICFPTGVVAVWTPWKKRLAGVSMELNLSLYRQRPTAKQTLSVHCC